MAPLHVPAQVSLFQNLKAPSSSRFLAGGVEIWFSFCPWPSTQSKAKPQYIDFSHPENVSSDQINQIAFGLDKLTWYDWHMDLELQEDSHYCIGRGVARSHWLPLFRAGLFQRTMKYTTPCINLDYWPWIPRRVDYVQSDRKRKNWRKEGILGNTSTRRELIQVVHNATARWNLNWQYIFICSPLLEQKCKTSSPAR